MVEPWLRGTLLEVEPVKRQVLHALELAGEDVERWCSVLSAEEMGARPGGVASVAFHLRHMARSLDRLLTYAEGRQLSAEQLAMLGSEMDPPAVADSVLLEFRGGLAAAMERVRALAPESYAERRGVGRQGLPTTVVGLMVHCAEHTQRHVGQAIVIARVVSGVRMGK